MRWIKKKYKIGEIHICSGFLFFPKKMFNANRENETRWLEKAEWFEEFLGYGEVNPNHEYWIKRNWNDE